MSAKTTALSAVSYDLDGQKTESSATLKILPTRVVEAHDDIGNILCEDEQLSMPEDLGILKWLINVYRSFRGGLSSMLMDGLRERYKSAVGQVEFILQVERSEKSATQNHYLNDTLEKW
jgi:hypothetical protein